MAVQEHIQEVRREPRNIKREDKYYRNKRNGYGRSIRLPFGIQRSTKAGDLWQPDTRKFMGTRETKENILSFIEDRGIKRYTKGGKLIC